MASVPAQPAMANARGRRSQQDVSGQETPAGTSALAQCGPTTPWSARQGSLGSRLRPLRLLPHLAPASPMRHARTRPEHTRTPGTTGTMRAARATVSTPVLEPGTTGRSRDRSPESSGSNGTLTMCQGDAGAWRRAPARGRGRALVPAANAHDQFCTRAQHAHQPPRWTPRLDAAFAWRATSGQVSRNGSWMPVKMR